jgi:hypothetical protein
MTERALGVEEVTMDRSEVVAALAAVLPPHALIVDRDVTSPPRSSRCIAP